MNAGGSGRCTIRIDGLLDGTPTIFDGQYVIEYDPSRIGTNPETGAPVPLFHLVTTPDIDRATRFGLAEAVHLYRAVDQRDPVRDDGEPNRPLTAFIVEFEPANEVPALTTERAPAAWYVDPNNPQYWRWWDGTTWTTHTAPR